MCNYYVEHWTNVILQKILASHILLSLLLKSWHCYLTFFYSEKIWFQCNSFVYVTSIKKHRGSSLWFWVHVSKTGKKMLISYFNTIALLSLTVQGKWKHATKYKHKSRIAVKMQNIEWQTEIKQEPRQDLADDKQLIKMNNCSQHKIRLR